MSWLGVHAWQAAWLFALIVPLVAFYFLKLKRPRLEVPSLVLWQQVMADQRVNSPFQKFKRNLLLWLQLATLLLLCLAALQPFIHASSDRADFLPVLIDTSASMAALDSPRGKSRLDEAKARVGELIDNMPPYQRISLIAFHGTARRLTDFTDNRRILRDALDKLQPADVSSRLEDGLRMTQALARTHPVKQAVMYTDGNVPPNVDFELPFELKVQTLAPAGANAGITAINARRTGADRWDIFVRLEASQAAEMSGKVELHKDGVAMAEDTVSMEKGGSSRLVFRVDTAKPSSLEVRFHPAGFDSLSSDNVAYLDLPEARPLKVRISPDLSAYQHALRDRDDLEINAEETPPTDTQWDLLISDAEPKEGEDATVGLFIGVVPEELASVLSAPGGAALVVDWDRASPLLQHVLLSDVQIAAKPQYIGGGQESDLENLGYRVLAHAQSGPLILEKRSGARTSYYLLFHTDVSTLPYRIGFPILVANAVQIALQSASLSEVRGMTTGVLPPQTVVPATAYRVTGPDDLDVEVTSGPDGQLTGVPAQRAGRYKIAGSGSSQTVGVSLLDSGETLLESVEKIQFKEISVTTSTPLLDQDKSLWPLLAGIGFVVLVVEWWFFQRRPGGFAAT